jgi:hypothetical protein
LLFQICQQEQSTISTHPIPEELKIAARLGSCWLLLLLPSSPSHTNCTSPLLLLLHLLTARLKGSP